MDSKIDQEVIDELIAMLEDHIAGGLKPEVEEAPAAEPEAEAVPGVEASEDAPAEEDDEDMKKLMEFYGRG